MVPEHFSSPVWLGQKHNLFQGAELELHEYPRGTGSMCAGLRSNELDIALALTEGLVADIIKAGPQITLIGSYVQSPLQWDIVASGNSPINSLNDLKGHNFGISRIGSGSHLMSFLLALQEGWNTTPVALTQGEDEQRIQRHKDINFVVAGGLQDLLSALESKKADAFLWETFMLKNHVDKNTIKKISAIKTPWPCFMIAARTELVQQEPDKLKLFLQGLLRSCELFLNSKQEVVDLISDKYKLPVSDVDAWYSGVKFTSDTALSKAMLENVIQTLVTTGVLKEAPNVSVLYNELVAKITP
jgi:sulfonate transport system substrate-binding protein